MSSDESLSPHPPRKRCRISEVSHLDCLSDEVSETSKNNGEKEKDVTVKSQVGGDDILSNVLKDHLVALSSSDSEENNDEGDEVGDNNDLNLFVEDHLKAVELLGQQVRDGDVLNESQALDDHDDSVDDQTLPSEGEVYNLSCHVHQKLQASEFVQEDENSYQCSQENVLKSFNIPSDPAQDMHFDTSNHFAENLNYSLILPEEDMRQPTNENPEDLTSHCDETFIAHGALDTEEDQWVNSTPMKQINTGSSSSWPHFSPIKIEDLFISHQVDRNSDDSSSESENGSSCHSEEDESDADSDISQEDSMSEFFVPINLIGEHEQTMNESNVTVLEPDAVSELVSTIRQYDIKLYSGRVVSVLSVQEAILQIMNLYLKDKLSKRGLNRLIKTICNFLPLNHKLPTTSYQVLSYIESLAPPVPATKHFYCNKCLFYHGESNTGHCAICKDNMFGHFFIFDVAALIKYFFEYRNLADIIDSETASRANRDPKLLTDLKDGSVYQALNTNRGKYDVNLMLNADGVRVKKGSKNELWLAMVTIAELPIRLQRSFLTIVGVWYHSKKPDMRVFLKPFSESLQYLDQQGVEWTHPTTREKHKSCVRLPLTILDAPARAMMQNTMMFNSRYGCNLCEIKTQKSMPVPKRKTVRVYHYLHNPPLRNKEKMLEQAEKVVAEDKEHIRGVKGPSVLSIVPSADVSKCIVPEYLHSVLLGVVKQLVSLWCNKPGPWSISHRITEIDAFLLTFKHPDFVHRASRQLKSLKNWKASDFYYFLLFEAVPALQGHLPEPYFQHFLLLVKSIFTLLKSSIKETEVTEAELLLKLFANQFLSLYGDRTLTHNVHQLCHLAYCVRMYGPLFCFSAFSSEDLNGMISKTTHGTMNVDVEIVHNIKICQGILMLENIVRGDHGLNIPHQNYASEGEFLGSEVSIKVLLSSEDLTSLPDSNPIIYAKAKLGYDTYTSEIYKALNSEDFNIMWNDQGVTKYGSIKYFAKCKGDNFVVIRPFTVDHTSVFYHKNTLRCIEQFIPIKISNHFVAVKFSDFVPNVVKVGKIGHYIYVRPHLYRFVL